MNDDPLKPLQCLLNKEWNEFRRETEISNRSVAKLGSKLDEIMEKTKHVPDVSQNLRETSETMRLIKDDLLQFVTGKRQVSLTSHLMTVLILGAIALVILVERSTKSIDITPTGIHIGNDPNKINTVGD